MILFIAIFFAQLLIDFGTQYIKTTTIKNRKPDIILDHQSKRKILNCVGYTSNLWIGNDCQSYLTRKPQNIAMSTKLLIPLLDKDTSVLKTYQQLFPIQINEDNTITLNNKQYTIIDIFAILINQIQEYDDPIVKSKDVYLILPHYYSYQTKHQLIQLSNILNCTITLLNDNTMAMIQYAQSNQLSNYFEENKAVEQHYIVLDMGHSTTLSVYTIKYYSTSAITSVNTMGLGIECLNQHHAPIGGYFIDLLLRDHMMSVFNKQYPSSNIESNHRAMMQLLVEAQKMKHVLSANNQVSITLEQLHDDKTFRFTINRNEFESLLTTIDVTTPIHTLLSKSNLSLNQIQSVVVVGGTIRIPYIQDQLKSLLGDLLNFQVDGDEGMTFGAAYQYMTLSPRFIMKPLNITDIIHYTVHLNDTIIFNQYSRVGLKKYLSFKKDQDYHFTLFIDNQPAYLVNISNIKWAKSKVVDPIKEKTRVLIEINKSGLITVGSATYDAVMQPPAPPVESSTETTTTESTETAAESTTSSETPVLPPPIKQSFPLTVSVEYLLPSLSTDQITASQTR